MIGRHPCGEDLPPISCSHSDKMFQSAHPVQSGTAPEYTGYKVQAQFQSTRSVQSEILGIGSYSGYGHVSIRPSRMRWDWYKTVAFVWVKQFQSTHPIWDGAVISPTARISPKIFQSAHSV